VANIRSSEKRNRQAVVRRARNTAVRNGVKNVVKKAREALAGGDAAKAKEAVRLATKMLDRAASKGVLHVANARRRISRLAQSLAAK
jgi:small subunit ribosomal protein S20